MKDGRLVRTLSKAEASSIPTPQPYLLTSLLAGDEYGMTGSSLFRKAEQEDKS